MQHCSLYSPQSGFCFLQNKLFRADRANPVLLSTFGFYSPVRIPVLTPNSSEEVWSLRGSLGEKKKSAKMFRHIIKCEDMMCWNLIWVMGHWAALTCRASQLLQVNRLSRLHGLGRNDGWIQSLAIKLQHGVLQNDVKLNKTSVHKSEVLPPR